MKYGDMLYMTYPFQTDRPRMNRADRAAQFSPFAALTGFDGNGPADRGKAGNERRTESGD